MEEINLEGNFSSGVLLFQDWSANFVDDRRLAFSTGDGLTDSTESREEVLRSFHSFGDVEIMAVILDEYGNVIYCNDYLLGILGWRREELQGANWCDLCVPPGQYPAELFVSQLREGAVPVRHENEIVTRNGLKRMVAWQNKMLFDSQGKPNGTASIGQDITDHPKRPGASIA